MCIASVTGSFATATIGEASGAQYAVNTLTKTLIPGLADFPAGTTITVTGLNAELAWNALIMKSIPEGTVQPKAAWTMPQCTKWCSSVGLCPATGSATDTGCMAVPYALATGATTSERCMRWCNTDSIIEFITTQEIAKTSRLVISFNLLNPTYSQNAATVAVSASSQGLYIAPLKMTQFVPPDVFKGNNMVTGVLSSSISPQFVAFTVAEETCNNNDSVYDALSGKWLGTCSGMASKIVVSMTPKTSTFTPASRLFGLPDPRWRRPLACTRGAQHESNFQIDDWVSSKQASR
jgi:hypothetical protein